VFFFFFFFFLLKFKFFLFLFFTDAECIFVDRNKRQRLARHAYNPNVDSYLITFFPSPNHLAIVALCGSREFKVDGNCTRRCRN